MDQGGTRVNKLEQEEHQNNNDVVVALTQVTDQLKRCAS
jgi:hypothetical protein